MQVLSQSAFLQALGYAIANSLWQAATLWLLVAGVNGLFKFASQVKYKIALLAQFSVFVWFLVTLQFYYSRCSEAIAQMRFSGLNSGNAFLLQPDNSSFSSVMLSAVLKGEKLLPYLSIAYLCLLAALAVRWIKGYRQTILIRTEGLQKIDIQWKLFVIKISELLNIKHKVGIYVSELVKSPLTIGFLKPLILIPIASINNLTTYQLEAVILHELAHIKRADYIINIIQSIIEITLFFNPFTQLLGKIIKRERENSCDDWVLQFQYDASTYAEALLRIAYMQQTPAFAMNAGGNEKDLLWRVKRMLNQKEKTFQYRNRLLALLLITGLLSSVAWFKPAVETDTAKQPAKSQAVMQTPITAQVDNPLFNPIFFMNKPFNAEIDKAAEDAGMNLRETTNYALGQANDAIARAIPAALSQIKTINLDLPSIISQAGNAVNTELKNINIPAEIAGEMKGDKDSSFVMNLLGTASGALKNIDWKKINKDIAAATKDLTKELADNDNFKGADGAQLKNLIKSSMATAQQYLSLVKLTPAENNDDENHIIVSPNGAVLQKQPSQKNIQLQKMQQKLIEVKKTVDSLRQEYSMKKLKQGTGAWDVYNEVAVNGDRPNVYSYSQPPANDYLPAKYDESGTPYNLSWGKNNEVSVSGTAKTTLIAVKEEPENAGSFKKKITIETLDSTGLKHVFHLTVEVYQ